MRFVPFDLTGTDDRKNRVRIMCDGTHLLLEAPVSLGDQTTMRHLAAWKVPVLTLTTFSTGAEDARRGLKRERHRTVQLAIALWDGRLQRTGPIDFDNVEVAETVLDDLSNQVATMNLKWPLCSPRETATRRIMVPGLIQRTDLLGPQGAEAFLSCLDSAPRDLVAVWSASELAHTWPLHYVQTDEVGSPLYLVLLPDRLVFIRPESPRTITQILGDTITGVDLRLGQGDAAGFSALLVSSPQVTEQFWLPAAHTDQVRSLYRYAITLWSYHRPFDDSDLVSAISSLDLEHESGRIDTVTFATLVQGIARRAGGTLPLITYPVEEQPYIRPPAIAQQVARGRTGPNPAQVRNAAVGVGLLAAAASTFMDE